MLMGICFGLVGIVGLFPVVAFETIGNPVNIVELEIKLVVFVVAAGVDHE